MQSVVTVITMQFPRPHLTDIYGNDIIKVLAEAGTASIFSQKEPAFKALASCVCPIIFSFFLMLLL